MPTIPDGRIYASCFGNIRLAGIPMLAPYWRWMPKQEGKLPHHSKSKYLSPTIVLCLIYMRLPAFKMEQRLPSLPALRLLKKLLFLKSFTYFSCTHPRRMAFVIFWNMVSIYSFKGVRIDTRFIIITSGRVVILVTFIILILCFIIRVPMLFCWSVLVFKWMYLHT